MKVCNGCHRNLPISNYYKSPSSRGGYNSKCKDCFKVVNDAYRNREEIKTKRLARTRQWELDNKDRSKRLIFSSHLKRSYGISIDDYESLLLNQKGMCAICGTTEPRGHGRMHVDHDHNSGRIRGLLCFPCNVALGKFKDDITLLQKAIDYLKER